MLGFIIWMLAGGIMIFYGIYGCFSKRKTASGFWANAKTFEVNDVKGYNRAVGILWCIFGVVFLLLGLPLLAGQNSTYAIISIFGVMAESVGAMVVYTVVIEKKYRR